MDTAPLYGLIIAGGKGERFWPLSTSKHPKQLLSLIGDKPLIAAVTERLHALIPLERLVIVTSHDLMEATSKVLPDVAPEQMIGEPIGRDTAAAIAVGTGWIKKQNPNAIVCVFTADHVIADSSRFLATLKACTETARHGELLVTMGIKPAYPSTAFGYIEMGDRMDSPGGITIRKALRFVEKPDRATAEEYRACGRYYWNSGMFIWSIPAIEKAFALHQPALAQLMALTAAAPDRTALHKLLAQRYPSLDRISIDYAVMEKADNIAVAEGDFGWDDVGSWTAIANHFPASSEGNTTIGHAEVVNGRNNIIVSRERLTAILGMDDLIVVQAEGATLICSRAKVQELKKLIEHLRAKGNYDHLL